MPDESISTVLDELRKELYDLLTAHGFACMGLRCIREYFVGLPKHPEDNDPIIHLESIVPDNPDWPKNPAWLPAGEWRLSEAIRQVQDNGPVEALLGRQWIVSVYALWEDEYRPLLAAARGNSNNEEKYPLLGDLRRLRHDVVHNRGVASLRYTVHCLVLRWFQPGEVIRVDGRHFEEFLRLFPWSQMAS